MGAVALDELESVKAELERRFTELRGPDGRPARSSGTIASSSTTSYFTAIPSPTSIISPGACTIRKVSWC